MDRRLQENVVGVERRVFVSVTADSNPAGFAAQIEQIPTRAGATLHNWAMDFGVGYSDSKPHNGTRLRALRGG
jgi:hypothetical protein